MITARKQFSFRGKCVLEKITVDKPARIGVDFPDEACYLYVLDGQLTVNGALSKTKLSPKDGVVLNCGYYFADFAGASPDTKPEVLAVHLDPDILREIFRSELPSFLKADSLPGLPGKTADSLVMAQFIESLLFYFDHPELVTDELLALKIRELILLLVQSTHAERSRAFRHVVLPQKRGRVRGCQHPSLRQLSVAGLARLAGMSTTSFKEAFAALFGEPPARYIRRKKIERAMELLQLSDYSIGEIALQVGYSDLSHFSKSFRAQCGCPPGVFKKRLLDAADQRDA